MVKQQVIAVDIETTGLDFQKDKIVLISAYSEDLELVTEDILDLKQILEDPQIKKIFHNASFDVKFLEQNRIRVNNYSDTMIMGQIVDGRTRNLKLDILSEEYLGIYLDKGLQHSNNWSGEITEAHKKYCLRDSKVTFELYKVLNEKIRQLELEDVLDREIKALPVITDLQRNGMRLDWEKWQVQLEQWEYEAKTLEIEIYKVLGEINLSSPNQLKLALEELGIMVENTTSDELKKFEAENVVVKDVRNYKKLKKYLNSYGEDLKAKIDGDGRIRASWWLIGAETGRMSCSSPAIQAMPKEIRKSFKAAEGKTFILADFSSIEMRILAVMSKDKTLSDAIKNGVDLHRLTASGVFNKSMEELTDQERQVGKVLNFGISYGMTSYGLGKKLSKALGRDVDIVEAERYRQKYFETYPGILRYQSIMFQAPWIKSLGGRYWGLKGRAKPKSSSKVINYPIQSSCAEGLKETMALLKGQLKGHQTWQVVAIIHDEIILEVPSEDSDEASKVLKQVMIDGMKIIVGNEIPIEVDVEVRDTWG